MASNDDSPYLPYVLWVEMRPRSTSCRIQIAAAW